jgi:integrase
VAAGEEIRSVKGYVVRKGSRFYAVIYEGVDPLTGRERRRWHPAGESRGEAELLAAQLAATASVVTRQSGPTLATYLLRQWLPAKEINLRPSTSDGYRRLIELHVVPRLGTVSVRRLRAEQLEALYAELLATGRRNGQGGLDPKTVLEVHIVLRKALADARRRGLVVHNVADDAEAPKRRRPNTPLRAWNVEQLQAFLAVARSKRLFPAFWVAATTGVRRSELLGLRWGDVDLGAGRLSIIRALVSVGYVLHDSPGKTRMSRRAVDLDALTVEVLRAWRALREDESDLPVGDDDYVFATPTGEPIHPDNFSKSFDRIVASASVPRLRLHDLRHTHASLLLKERVPIKVVSERLGHSTPGFTMATYQHVLPGMQADAARVFAGLIASTGFNPVEGSVDRPLGAVK